MHYECSSTYEKKFACSEGVADRKEKTNACHSLFDAVMHDLFENK
jgi:hypothetical protein